MIEKFELIDLRHYISPQECTGYNKLCLSHALTGISCFSGSLAFFNTLDPRTNISVLVDTLLPREDIGVIYDKILSIKEQYGWVNSFIIPLDVNNLVYAEDVFAKIITLGNIRPAINYQTFYDLELMKEWVSLFEEYDAKNAVLFGHLPKEYNTSDQLIIAGRVLSNSNLTISLFGKYSKKQLLEYKMLENPRITSLGMSCKNIFNLLPK